MPDIKEKLVELIGDAPVWQNANIGEACTQVADYLIAHGVTVQEQNGQGCPYCDIAKANEGVINTALWVKEPETNKWTMMGKRLKFCPMCGRRLPQPPKGE